MSNMIGMDSSEVRTLATNIRAQAERITTLINGIDVLVHQIASEWIGPDASEFVVWWQQQHRPALVAAESAVMGLAQSAENRAKAQDEASSALVGGSAVGAGLGAAAGAVTVSRATGVSPATTSSQESQFQSSIVGTAQGQIHSTDQALYDSATGEQVGGAWCASFVTWVLKQNGYTTPPVGADSVSSWITAAQSDRNGLSIVPTPQPGDLVVYSYGASASGPFIPSHIGIVTSASGSAGFTAVSGNFDVNGTPQVAPTLPHDAYSSDGVNYSSYLGEYIEPTFIHVAS